MDWIHHKIWDRVINGKEYQLIKRMDLLECMQQNGLELEFEDRLIFKDVVKPILQDFINVEHVIQVLKRLGIVEDMPPASKYMNYDKLSGREIRIFNKINNYMQTHNIADVLGIFSPGDTYKIVVQAKDKQEEIDVIHEDKLEAVLKSK